MNATFVRYRHEAENIITFYFLPERPFVYIAGQYVEVILIHPMPDEHGIKHPFTLSSSPADELLSITTKFPPQPSSFKRALKQLNPGATVTINGPLGEFVLPQDPLTRLLFIAGGIGITPFHSMIRWLEQTEEERQVNLIYSVGSENEIIFRPILNSVQNSSIIVTRPISDWQGYSGYLTGDFILQHANLTNRTLIYISGPAQMVQSIKKDMMDKGIELSRIVLDVFEGYEI